MCSIRSSQSTSHSTMASEQKSISPQAANPRLQNDDRYPGSFFRIPGVTIPGKTTWSLSK